MDPLGPGDEAAAAEPPGRQHEELLYLGPQSHAGMALAGKGNPIALEAAPGVLHVEPLDDQKTPARQAAAQSQVPAEGDPAAELEEEGAVEIVSRSRAHPQPCHVAEGVLGIDLDVEAIDAALGELPGEAVTVADGPKPRGGIGAQEEGGVRMLEAPVLVGGEDVGAELLVGPRETTGQSLSAPALVPAVGPRHRSEV